MKLRDYQEMAVDSIFEQWQEHDSTLIVCPTGSGKCLDPSTPVMMDDGTVKPAREVVTGEALMGADSERPYGA